MSGAPRPLVVDTSVLIAILLAEPEWEEFDLILAKNLPLMAMPSRLEADVVAQARMGLEGPARLAESVASYGIGLELMDEAQYRAAQAGLLAFGRGRRAMPSLLNFGDLFAYGLAKARDLPLLYKGDDFAGTDVRSARRELLFP